MRALRVAVLAAVLSSPVAAQQQSAARPTSMPEFVVRTVPLHHLSSAEAVKLLSPYSQTPGGGVYEAPGVRAVTIREVSKIFSDMMGVLAQYDRERGSVTLYFQLIAAESTTVRDPAVAGLDSLLRGVLRYSGYRLLSTTIASASDAELVTQSLSADGDPLTLSVTVSDLRVDGNDASVHLAVDLRRPPMAISNAGKPYSSTVLSTGVTVPIGQTVVLGAATTTSGRRALILAVRPQLATPKR
jgi:type II secretory pathway component GspD/PulD (secretin)